MCKPPATEVLVKLWKLGDEERKGVQMWLNLKCFRICKRKKRVSKRSFLIWFSPEHSKV